MAIWLPESVSEALGRSLEPLRGEFQDIHWQPAKRWHITLAFLGERDPGRESARFATIPAIPAGPIRLAAGGRFGPVLWIGVEGKAWLGELAVAVQRVHHCAERRFRAHVTIGRSRTPVGARQIVHASRVLSSFTSPSWTPAEITLVRSTTGPRPAYDVIARSPLQSS